MRSFGGTLIAFGWYFRFQPTARPSASNRIFSPLSSTAGLRHQQARRAAERIDRDTALALLVLLLRDASAQLVHLPLEGRDAPFQCSDCHICSRHGAALGDAALDDLRGERGRSRRQRRQEHSLMHKGSYRAGANALTLNRLVPVLSKLTAARIRIAVPLSSS